MLLSEGLTHHEEIAHTKDALNIILNEVCDAIPAMPVFEGLDMTPVQCSFDPSISIFANVREEVYTSELPIDSANLAVCIRGDSIIVNFEIMEADGRKWTPRSHMLTATPSTATVTFEYMANTITRRYTNSLSKLVENWIHACYDGEDYMSPQSVEVIYGALTRVDVSDTGDGI